MGVEPLCKVSAIKNVFALTDEEVLAAQKANL
jgi:hypothetical protein